VRTECRRAERQAAKDADRRRRTGVDQNEYSLIFLEKKVTEIDAANKTEAHAALTVISLIPHENDAPQLTSCSRSRSPRPRH
jgi:hypothetical protein